MIGELMHVVFARFLLGFIILAIIGLFAGNMKSRGSRITLWLFMAIVVAIWTLSSGTLHSYGRMARVAAISSDDVDFLWFGSIACLMGIYTLMQMLGSVIRRHSEQEAIDAVNQLDVDQVLEITEVILSNPQFASTPWIQSNWNVLPPAHKTAWIHSNLDELKAFFIQHGGLEEFGHAELIVELQRIDRKRLNQQNEVPNR